jgi:RNA polymerase sigma-70 factor (ECF subfamily)
MNSHRSPLIELFSTSDEELAIQTVHDSAAFAELYHRHFQRVYRFLLANTGNVSEAQDLTTQTFLAALEGISTYRGESTFIAWLMGIARNKSAMHFRLRKRELPLENADELTDPAPSPETVAVKRIQLNQVIQALRRLTPERAEAIMLYLFADLSAAEAGEAMNKSQAAVKMLVLRGLRELRRQLSPIQEVDG